MKPKISKAQALKRRVLLADIFTGMYASTAILAAIVHRDKTGEGQYIDMSLLDTQVAVMANVSSAYLTSGEVPKRWGNASPIIVPYQTFPTSDGWTIVGAGNDGQFRHFVTAGSEAHLAENPLFASNPLRVEHRKQLIPLLEQMTRKKAKQSGLHCLNKPMCHVALSIISKKSLKTNKSFIAMCRLMFHTPLLAR